MTTTGKLSDSLLLTCESWQDSYGNNTDFIHSCCRIYPDDTIVERATLISTIDWTQHAGGGTA